MAGQKDDQGSESSEAEPRGELTNPQILERVDSLAKQVATARSNPVLYILYPKFGMIREPHSTNLYQMFLDENEFEDLDVIIHSTGGDLHDAYDMVKLCRRHTSGEVTVFVPVRAMSAATLIALGADNVILSEIGKLGPLDPQIRHPDTGEYIPVRAVTDAPKVLEEALVPQTGDINVSQKSSSIIKPIAKQVDPYKLAEHDRTADLAREYGQKLLKRRNVSEERARRCLNYMIEYPTHGYSVDIQEIEENPTLGDVINAVRISSISNSEMIEISLMALINYFMYYDYRCIKRDETKTDPELKFVFPRDEEQEELPDAEVEEEAEDTTEE